MKLISLNLWGGRIYPALEAFLKKYADDVDIFCFQEIYNNAEEGMSDEERKHRPYLLTDLQQLLPNYTFYFRPVIKTWYGIGIFVKKGVKVLEEGALEIYTQPHYDFQGGDHTRNLQWIHLQTFGNNYHIANVHGLWTEKGKVDTPQRIIQSEIIKKHLSSITIPTILCGDFNLLPDTQSMKILEEHMINLIKKHHITSTRSHYYTKAEKFADYVLVSKQITVKDFKVLQDAVSDHLALFLEFE